MKKFNWRENRLTLFALFLYTAFYTLYNPKPARKIVNFYEKGLELSAKERLDDLAK